MQNPEAEIEKVLAALRNSEVPPAMNLRLLAAAKQAASERDSSRSPGGMRPWRSTPVIRQWASTATVAAVCAGIIIALTITVIHEHRPAGTDSKLHRVPPETESTASSARNAALSSLGQISPPGRTEIQETTQRARLIRSANPAHPHPRQYFNHPAPEAPLSQQERLLLRIAQSGNPKELAMLNSQLRAQQEAEDEAEFQKFVEPPTGIDQQ